MRHGGQILVDCLKAQGVTRVFCVPGESYLPVLDGLYNSGIDVVICRHEGGATMMAEAHGKLTGTPGVAFVTRGPGATNASAGVHVARQDSTPMILFIGQVSRGYRDREAFQEVDFRAMFGPLAKWVAEIETTERIPEYIGHAFATAMNGRPGPVVLSLVEDALFAAAEVADIGPVTRVAPRCTRADAEAIWARLRGAERPLVIVGGGAWTATAAADVARLAERSGLPVATAFRRQDYIDNTHANYVGDFGIGPSPALRARIDEADTIVLLGTRLSEMASGGYKLLDVPTPRQTLIHTHADAGELGRVYHAALAINADSPSVVAQLLATCAPEPPRWQAWTRAGRADYERYIVPQPTVGDVRLEEVVAHLNAVLPPDAILTNGAGNYASWLHRYYRYRAFRSQLAPTSGSMGYGLPAAIAAKLQHPGRPVVCLAGDGCFQMTMQEFGSAAQYGANVVVIVCNNSSYGTIRMHQEREYPGRVVGTMIRNPDFAALARSYGGFGEKVSRTADFPKALEAAMAAGVPALIELQMDQRAVSHRLVAPAQSEVA
jgi:acetolactate synthase-1/2/3 large subunit